MRGRRRDGVDRIVEPPGTGLAVWAPEPGWQALGPSMSSATVGVWRVRGRDGESVVKRISAPRPGDAAELSWPRHYGYWRREVDVALDLDLPAGSGLRPVSTLRVEEDEDGVTLWSSYVEATPLPGPYVARALGRLAATRLDERPWWCRDQLRDRLVRIADHGGWRTLGRTTVADLADALWTRRRGYLDGADALPHGPVHGDVAPANLCAADGEDVLAVDWRMFGTAPVGADLGYFWLSCREEPEVLVDAFLAGHEGAGGTATRDEVLFAARLTAVYTVFSQAEWALARVASGEGALAAKYRHPAVAPYLRALQRQFPQIEALLGAGVAPGT